MQTRQDKTRGGAANSLGGQKREAEVNKYLEEVVVDDTDDDDEAAEDSRKKGHAPIQVSMMLDQKSCEMQLDTGATVSILPKTLYDHRLISGHCGVPRLSQRLTMGSTFQFMERFGYRWYMISRKGCCR